MRYLILAVALALTACGPAGEPVCEGTGLQFFSAFEPDCEFVAEQVTVAKNALDSAGILDRDDWSPFVGTSVEIRAEFMWKRADGKDVAGTYRPPTNEIFVGRAMEALLHEMIHRIFHHRGIQEADDHVLWTERQFEMDRAYKIRTNNVLRAAGEI